VAQTMGKEDLYLQISGVNLTQSEYNQML